MHDDLLTHLQDVVGPGYHIDRELGGGGMSRVFVATELELDRQVVIKVLPPDFAAGINVDRFRREIQLAARLQHPHIVPLLSAGAKGSLLYYTMPYIEGETLRSRLNHDKTLSIQDASRILRDVADALTYAHSKGIVHRDIKPENIVLSGGHSLVLDFGVSKAISQATADSATPNATLTSAGTALGTVAYMSPEQAAADPNIDSRADIYSLGIVGYELLAGQTPFAGLGQQQTLSAHVLTIPAPLTKYRRDVPDGLAHAVMRCLEKDPSNRWQNSRDLQVALEPYGTTSGAAAAISAGSFAWTRKRIAVSAGALGLAASLFILASIAFRRNETQFVVGDTKQVTNFTGLELQPSLSPDGKVVAYAAGIGEKMRIYVRQLSGGRAIALTDSSTDAQWPQWSPDGQKILYMSGNRSYTVPAFGGSPVLFSDTANLVGCKWSNKGDRLACSKALYGGIVIADANGEHAQLIPHTVGNDGAFAPSWSADDKLIAFVRGNPRFLVTKDIGNLASSSIWVARADGGDPVRITDDTHLNTSPVWTLDGQVMFVSSLRGNRDIYLQKLGSDLKPRGDPLRLTTGLNAHTIALDRTGTTLIYGVFSATANTWASPLVNATDSSMRPLTSGNQTVESMSISPDGKWLAFDSDVNGNQDIYKISTSGGEPQQLTHNDADDFSPVWSPDGRYIAYHSMLSGNRDVYVMDGSGGNNTRVTSAKREELIPIWGLDDNTLIFRVFPDSMFMVRKTATGWSSASFVSRGSTNALSPDGKQVLVGAEAGAMCTTCAEGFYLVNLTDKTLVPVDMTGLPKSNVTEIGIVWNRINGDALAPFTESDGSSSIWRLPVNGRKAARVFHLTNPAKRFYRSIVIDVDSSHFYFILGDRQSDIWMMQLKRK